MGAADQALKTDITLLNLEKVLENNCLFTHTGDTEQHYH